MRNHATLLGMIFILGGAVPANQSSCDCGQPDDDAGPTDSAVIIDATISASIAPDGFAVGDFSLNSQPIPTCEQVATCEASITSPGTYTIGANIANGLCASQQATVEDSELLLLPLTCGLAANGEYCADWDPSCSSTWNLETRVEGGKILLNFENAFDAEVNGATFRGEHVRAANKVDIYTGSISLDLCEVVYHKAFTDGNGNEVAPPIDATLRSLACD